MPRYLMYISYLGTRFRSVQKQVYSGEPTRLDPDSVQGLLEICLRRYCPTNVPFVQVASRTDQGAHALRTAVHFDLTRRGGCDYDPDYLSSSLNDVFTRNGIEMRVQSCRNVPSNFHARHHAKSRTYLYRLAVRRGDAPSGSKNVNQMSIAELNRCHFIQKTEFDVQKFKTAASLFPGVKDFRTFMGCNSGRRSDVPTTRLMHSLDIVSGEPLLNAKYSPSSDEYNFWDITCKSKSFLYRQFRRTVGALVAVAQGTLSVADIQHMLDYPSADSWNPKAVTVPAHGLYLLDVEYDEADFMIPEEVSSDDDSPSGG